MDLSNAWLHPFWAFAVYGDVDPFVEEGDEAADLRSVVQRLPVCPGEVGHNAVAVLEHKLIGVGDCGYGKQKDDGTHILLRLAQPEERITPRGLTICQATNP